MESVVLQLICCYFIAVHGRSEWYGVINIECNGLHIGYTSNIKADGGSSGLFNVVWLVERRSMSDLAYIVTASWFERSSKTQIDEYI